MSPPKAEGWPLAIYNDADVLTLDKLGHFIICGVCAEYYATCGGKKPKPVALNGCFCTRAWDVHKKRTRAHYKQRGRWQHCSPPAIALSNSAANTWLQPFFLEQRSIGRSLQFGEATSASTQAFDDPPLHDQRRAIDTRSSHSSKSDSPSWINGRQSVVPSWRLQQIRATHSTLVFPLVRRRSELRNSRDLDPAWSDAASGYTWHPRAWTSAYEQRAISKSTSDSSLLSQTDSDHSQAAICVVSDDSQ